MSTRERETGPSVDGHAIDGKEGQAGDAALADEARAELMRLFPEGVPNLYRTMLRNPTVIAALTAMKLRLRDGTLTAEEHCLIALEVARDAECGYCEAALCHEAREVLGLEPEAAEPADPRQALVIEAARAVMAARGRLGRAELAAYERRGLDFEQMLEIVAVISEYTLATYAANMGRPRIDPDYRLG
jgi:alkylhydroperoxidase family enzyme